MLKKFAAFVFIMLLALPAMAEELSTKYFTVNMPDDWKVIMPPTENQGITSAVFAKNTSGVSVTMVVGPSSGADAKTIAGMFATQFKAEKPRWKRTASTPSTSLSRKCPVRPGWPFRATCSWSAPWPETRRKR